MGTWTLGADNATVRNVPSLAPGPIQARRPIPQLSRINAIRFDGKSLYHGLTFKVERRLANDVAFNVSYTLSHSTDDASSPGATESETNVPQDVRNIFDEIGEWALSSFDHRHQFIASGVYQVPVVSTTPVASPKPCSAAGAPTPSSSPRAARRSRSTSASTAPTSAPARPSVPTSSRDPNLPGDAAVARALVRHVGVSRCRRPSRSAAPRATAWSGRGSPPSTSRWPRPGPSRGSRRTRVPVGGLQPPEPRQLRPAESHLR